MLYDSLAASRLSGKYSRLEGRITSLGNFAEALAGLIGGMLALLSLRTPFIIQSCIAFLAVPAALMLVEPPVKIAVRKRSVNDIVGIVRNTLVTDPKLRWNTFFSAIIGCSTLTMAWFAQPFFKQVNLPLEGYGVLWAVLNLSVGLAALGAWRFEKKLGPARTVTIFTIVIISGFMLLALFPGMAALLILVVFYLARGIATPTLRSYINNITTSDVRATVLSVRNFVIRLTFAVLGPFFGYVTDVFGLSTALFVASVSFGIPAFVSLYYFVKLRTYESDS